MPLHICGWVPTLPAPEDLLCLLNRLEWPSRARETWKGPGAHGAASGKEPAVLAHVPLCFADRGDNSHPAILQTFITIPASPATLCSQLRC